MYVLFCSFDSSDRKSKSWREVETATDEHSAEEIESDEQGNVSRCVCCNGCNKISFLLAAWSSTSKAEADKIRIMILFCCKRNLVQSWAVN